MTGSAASFYFPRPAELWFGFLGGPTIFFVVFLGVYALVPWICRGGGPVAALHILTLLGMAAVAWAGWLSWRGWRRLKQNEAPPEEAAPGRSRLMLVGGLVMNAFFFLVLLAQEVANFSPQCG